MGEFENSESALTEAQLADLRARLADPGPIASDAEADAFFARLLSQADEAQDLR